MLINSMLALFVYNILVLFNFCKQLGLVFDCFVAYFCSVNSSVNNSGDFV